MTRSSPERREQKHKGKKRPRAWHRGESEDRKWQNVMHTMPVLDGVQADLCLAHTLPLYRVGNTNRGATAP